MKSHAQLEVLAGSVHAVISTLNLLAFAYNVLNGNKKRAAFHVAVAAYEAHAVYLHTKEGGAR